MIQSIAVVMRGTIAAQLVGVAVLPVLTRHFSPAAFGHFQVFQSLLGLSLVVATMRYEIAILRAETPRELGALVVVCGVINLSVAMVLIVGRAVYECMGGAPFADIFGTSFALLVGAFVLGGTVQYLGYLLVREQMFSQNSNSKVIQALTNAGTAFVFALTRPIGSGIVIADVAGRAGALMAMLGLSLRGLKAHVAWPSLHDIGAAVRKFRAYPLVSVPGGLVNMAGATMTPIMIYRTFDVATSGQFGLLERSASLPIALIATSISQVYMAQLARDLRTSAGNALRHFDRLIGTLAVAGIVPAIAIAACAPWLFATVFGPGWEQAALFARLMMPSYWLAMLSGAVNMTLIVVGRQRTQLVWEIARLAAMGALWTSGATWGWRVDAMVAGHSAILTAFAMMTVLLSRSAIRRSADRDSGIGKRPAADDPQ